MDFEKMVVYMTFIPWMLYFMKNSFTIMKELKEAKKMGYAHWFKKNFYRIFRMDTLLLLALFFYFARYNTAIVNKLLFTVIHLYMWVNTFYDNKESKERFEKSDMIPSIFLLLCMVIPIIWFEKALTQVEAYKLMCIFTFFTFVFVVLAKLLSVPITNLWKKKKSVDK